MALTVKSRRMLAARKERFGSTDTSKSVCLSPVRRSLRGMATSMPECASPYTPKDAPFSTTWPSSDSSAFRTCGGMP